MLSLKQIGCGYRIVCDTPSDFEYSKLSHIMIGNTTYGPRWAFWSDIHNAWLVRKEDRDIAADYIAFHNKRFAEEKSTMKQLVQIAEEMGL